VAQVAQLLAEARRPLIIAGGGVIHSGATSELERLAELAGVFRTRFDESIRR